MPGEYEDTGGAPPLQANLLSNLHGAGPPLRVPAINGFQHVAMDHQSGGPVIGAQVPGFWTGQRTDCIVVAVMQHNGLGAWMSYYFAHLRGGRWTATEQALFNLVITHPANAFIAMDSNAFSGMEIVLGQMNAGNPAGNIPLAHLLRYKSPHPTFALRLADSAIGQIP